MVVYFTTIIKTMLDPNPYCFVSIQTETLLMFSDLQVSPKLQSRNEAIENASMSKQKKKREE